MAMPPPARAATGYHRCGGKFTSDDGLRFNTIRARKVSCGTAREVTRQMVFVFETQSQVTRVEVFDQVDRSWTCTNRTAYSKRGDPYGFITWVLAGGRRVKFNGYS